MLSNPLPNYARTRRRKQAPEPADRRQTQKYGNMTDRTVTTTYDLSGRLKTLDYPSNLTLTYTYHNRERGGSLQFGGGQTAISKGRKPRRGGNWDSTTIDGTTDTRTHNSVNELTVRTNPSTSLSYDDAWEPDGSVQFGLAQTAISKGRQPRRDGRPKTGADEAEVGEGRSP